MRRASCQRGSEIYGPHTIQLEKNRPRSRVFSSPRPGFCPAHILASPLLSLCLRHVAMLGPPPCEGGDARTTGGVAGPCSSWLPLRRGLRNGLFMRWSVGISTNLSLYPLLPPCVVGHWRCLSRGVAGASRRRRDLERRAGSYAGAHFFGYSWAVPLSITAIQLNHAAWLRAESAVPAS